MNRTRAIEVMQDVADDMASDAAHCDGRPFNGRTVGEYLGNHGAAIAAVATCLKELLVEAQLQEQE